MLLNSPFPANILINYFIPNTISSSALSNNNIVLGSSSIINRAGYYTVISIPIITYPLFEYSLTFTLAKQSIDNFSNIKISLFYIDNNTKLNIIYKSWNLIVDSITLKQYKLSFKFDIIRTVLIKIESVNMKKKLIINSLILTNNNINSSSLTTNSNISWGYNVNTNCNSLYQSNIYFGINRKLEIDKLIYFGNKIYDSILDEYTISYIRYGPYNEFFWFYSYSLGNIFNVIEKNYGFYNCACGANVLEDINTGQFNCALGIKAGKNIYDGNYNLFIGDSSGFSTKNGNYNIGIGLESLYGNVNGNHNIGIGRKAGSASLSDNNICIGAVINYNTENKLIIGYINGGANLSCIQILENNSIYIGPIFYKIYTYGRLYSISDIRDKTNIKDTLLGLDFINKLRPVDFIYIKDKTNKLHNGFIAQEIELLNDTFINIDENSENNKYFISYSSFIAPIVKAIQELYIYRQNFRKKLLSEIKMLSDKISLLENKNIIY